MEYTANDDRTRTMTASQVGRFLGGLSHADVQGLIDTTDIPHHTVGGEFCFDLEELTGWIDRNTIPASGPRLSPDELAALSLGS